MEQRINITEFLDEIKSKLEEISSSRDFGFNLADDFSRLWRDEVRGIFDGLIKLTVSEENNAQLKKYGLSGEQFKLKLRIWDSIRDSGIIDAILDFINSLLSSLGKCFPAWDLIKGNCSRPPIINFKNIQKRLDTFFQGDFCLSIP
jgi:hypothetical protein